MLLKLLSHMDRSRFSFEVVSMTNVGPIGMRIVKLGIPVLELGMRSGVPDMPFDKAQPATAPPTEQEGRTPQRQPEHRPPPPSRLRGYPPQPGPQPQRKLAA